MAQIPGGVYDYEGITRVITGADKNFSRKSVEDFDTKDLTDINQTVTRLKTKFSKENTKVVDEGSKLQGDQPEIEPNSYNVHMYRTNVATHKGNYIVLSYYIEIAIALQEDMKLEKEKKESEARQNDIEEKWANVQKAASKIVPHDPNQQKSKNRPELQPQKLLASMTFYQQQSWMTQWLQYRQFSKFDKESLEIQHSLLLANIEEDLVPLLRPKFKDNNDSLIPIIDDDKNTKTCMTVIKDHWAQTFPLVTRRVKYFQSEPEAGKLTSAWLTDLTRLAKESDANSMTAEEVYCFLAMSKCKDEKILEKLLELKKVTKATLEEKVLEIEQLQRTQGAILKSDINLIKSNYRKNQEKAMSPGQNQAQEGQGKRSAWRNKFLPAGYKDMCTRCGDLHPTHSHKECPEKDSAKCSEHGKGHSDKACLKKIRQKIRAAKADKKEDDKKESEDKPTTQVNTLRTSLNSVSMKDLDPSMFEAEIQGYD